MSKRKRMSVRLYNEAARLAMQPYLSIFTYHPELDVWEGNSPELRGCRTQADTLTEARLMMQDARVGYIAVSLLYGQDVPKPSGLVQEVVVNIYDSEGNRI